MEGQRLLIDDTGSKVIREIVNQMNEATDRHERYVWMEPTDIQQVMVVLREGQNITIKDVVIDFSTTAPQVFTDFGISIAYRRDGYWDPMNPVYPPGTIVAAHRLGFTTHPVNSGDILNFSSMQADDVYGTLPLFIKGPCQVRFCIPYFNHLPTRIFPVTFMFRTFIDKTILSPGM